MSEPVTLLIGRPENFDKSADGKLYPVPGYNAALVLGDDGIFYPVGAVVIPTGTPGDGTMGDSWQDDSGFVVAGTTGQPTTPAAPPGGWCFKTINGVLTAVACNASSSNTPQGTILSSADTRAIQQALNRAIGAGLAVDGNFGPKTAAAVRTFQSRNGLAATGVVDNATRARLFAAPPAANNTSGGAGAGLQQNFNQPPPNSGFSLSSLFSGIDSTTMLLIGGVVAVALATRR